MKKTIAFAVASVLAIGVAVYTGPGSPAAEESAVTGEELSADLTEAVTEADSGDPESVAEETMVESAEEVIEEETEMDLSAPLGEDPSTEELLAYAEEGMTTTIACEPFTLTLASAEVLDGTIGGEAVNAAIAAAARWTNGNFVVDFHQGGELGEDVELLENVQKGTIDIYIGSPASQTALIPGLAVLDIPGLYEDTTDCNQVIRKFKSEFQMIYNENDLRLQEIYAPSFLVLSSAKPVASASDLSTLKIGSKANPYHMTFWKALGTLPSPSTLGDLYDQIQQGELDAQENTLSVLVSSELAKVQKYVIKTNHLPYVNTLVTNRSSYERLSDSQKLALDQFCHYIAQYNIAGALKNDAHLETLCREEYGMNVSDVSAEIQSYYPTAAQAVITQMKTDGDVDEQFIDTYLAAAGFTAP